MITIDEVVDAIITGVERRAAMIVVPRRNSLVARVPGLVRPPIDRIGFRGNTIPDAIALATPSGEPVGR